MRGLPPTILALVFLVPGCGKSSDKKVESSSQPSSEPVAEVADTPEPRPKPVTYELSAAQEAAIFDAPVQTLQGEETTLASYRGKSLMVVNVASECGLTPQYEQLQALQTKYADKDFTVIGFPSNQFGEQEPGTPEEILAFGKEQFGVTFPLMQKVETNGDNRHPIYAALTEIKDARGEAGDVAWNFEKFIISADGKHITRLRPDRLPDDAEVVSLIEKDLQASADQGD